MIAQVPEVQVEVQKLQEMSTEGLWPLFSSGDIGNMGE